MNFSSCDAIIGFVIATAGVPVVSSFPRCDFFPSKPERTERSGTPFPTGITDALAGFPADFQLFPNYPDPFYPETTIRFGLPRESLVRLEVFHIFGKRIALLVSERLEPGYHDIRWNTKGDPSGIFYCRFQTGDGFADMQKLLLLK